MNNGILFFKTDTYNLTAAQIQARIAQIDAITDELYNTALVIVAGGEIAEYDLDTGQSKQKVVYRTQSEIYNAIDFYDKFRRRLQAKLAPGVVRLMDSKNIR